MSRMSVVDHFNTHVEQMHAPPWFYDWVLDVWDAHAIPRHARICDVGCGTGALLARLHARGYQHLTGVDFAPNCVLHTQQALPAAHAFLHDIERASLPRHFDAIMLTSVLDVVSDPMAVLRHIRASLRPGALFFVTFRNRMAYWPFYYLRGLLQNIPIPRLRHWCLWFTTPLGMRRDWPHEYVYSPAELEFLLRSSGFQPVAEYGFQWLPMLWIPELPRWMKLMRHVDAWSRRLPGKARHYYYMIVCTADAAQPSHDICDR